MRDSLLALGAIGGTTISLQMRGRRAEDTLVLVFLGMSHWSTSNNVTSNLYA